MSLEPRPRLEISRRTALPWPWLLGLALSAFAAEAPRSQINLLGQKEGAATPKQQMSAAGPARKGFVPPGAPKSGPAPFLTEAISWEVDKYSKFSEQLVYPTQNKTDAPFYDVPFAVNVPFEVPFDGGAVKVFFDVNIVWDEPETRTQLSPPGSPPRPLVETSVGAWAVFQQGIYRMDRTPIPAGAARWEVNASDSRPMTWQTDAPFPVLLNGEPPTATRGSHVTTRVDVSSNMYTPKPRRPFTDLRGEFGGFAAGRPLVLQAAPPGWYALWFTLTPRLWTWPAKPLRSDDTLRAKIHVHYMVARRERFNGQGEYFAPVDLEYIWTGADKKPTVPIDPNLVRAYSVEVPVTLQRDGWVFVRSEIKRARPANDFLDAKLPARESDKIRGANVVATAQPNARGFTAHYASSVFERANRADPWPRQPLRAATMTWDVVFPTEIDDGGPGVIAATGTLKKEGGDAEFRNRRPVHFGDDSLPSSWIERPGKVTQDPRNVGSLLELVSSSSAGDRDTYLKSWGWKLADPDASRFWQLVPDNQPPAGNAARRFTVIARLVEAHVANAWTRETLPMLYQDVGPQPLFQIDAGPWRVEAHYRRKKDAAKITSGTPVATETQIANEKDDYWEWFPKYSRLLHQTDADTRALEKQVGIERELLQQQRRTARVLLDAYQTANASPGFGDWFGSSATRAEFSEAMKTRLIQAAGKANTEAFAHVNAIRDRIEKIRQAHQAVLTEIDGVFLRHLDRHPELTLYRRERRALLEQVDFKLALGTGDLGLFQAAMTRANLQPEGLQPEALVAMAQLQLENGDPAGALENLRRAVRLDPKNLDARDRLRDVECAIIKVALEKSQGAIADARKHFNTYLKERGFGDRDQAWVGGVRARGLSSYDAESAWAVFTTGVTGAVSGLIGRPEEEARALDATERDMTVAFLGAHSILRLRMRNLTLEKIGSLSTSQLQEELTAGAAGAPAMTRDRALQLGMAIHSAFRLPELQALLKEDSMALREAQRLGYWDPKDVGNTWAEWVGDLTSPKNLVMTLMPMSVGRVGGQLQGVTYWTRAEASVLQGAMRTGYVDSGTMVVAEMIGWNRALGAIGSTRAGESFIRLLERSQKYQESLGLFGQAGWTLNKMVAMMALQGAAVHSAEQLAGPRAALAVEAMLLFAGDTDLLVKGLDAARISRQTARLTLDQFRVTAERQREAMLAIRKRVIDLEHEVLAKQRQTAAARGAKTTPLGKGGTGSGTGAPGSGAGGGQGNVTPLSDPRPVIPNGQPANDALVAIRGASDGLDQGSNNGAIAAAEILGQDLDDEVRLLSQKIDDAVNLSQKLAAPPTPPPPPRPLATGKFASREAGNYRLPPHPGNNQKWLEAERALLEGNFPEAEMAFLDMKRQLARDTQSGRPISPHELPLELLERRIAQARALKTTPKPVIDRELTKGIVDAIPEAEVEQILRLRRVPLPADDLGAAGMMSFAGDHFMVKELAPGKGKLIEDSIDLFWSVEGEIVGSEIARALGTPTPGINAKVKWRMGDRGPEMESVELVYRRVTGTTATGERVNGTSLHKLTDAELFHCREQLADQRVASLLIGDYDRKPDNYMLLGGVVHQLDSGQADVRADKIVRAFGKKDAPISVAGEWGSDHWWNKAFKSLAEPRPDKAKIQQIFLSESALSFEHAAPALARIKDKLKDPAKLAELRESIRKAYRILYKDNPRYVGRDPRLLELELDKQADEVLEAMQARLPGVEAAMKDMNLRTGQPRPTASRLAPRTRGTLIPFPNPERMAA